jgi:uncharacterized repeat protein (TIGR03803 family)
MSIKNLFAPPVLRAALSLMLTGNVTAQTFTTLYNFTPTSDSAGPPINSDGASPSGGLILSGNVLYGTAAAGGTAGEGTIFKVNTDGTGFSTLYSFTALSPYDPSNPQINSDGVKPSGLVLSSNILYGTASSGGNGGSGTVFKLNTDGTGFTTLYSFTPMPNSDGALPFGLTLSGSTLYGTASRGGSSGYGTVFAINSDGSGFTTLYDFTAVPAPCPCTNSDGGWPSPGLVLSGDALYGTAQIGGSSDDGTVFALNTDGTGFTTLYSFPGGSNGAHPGGLIISGNTLYGATGGYGTVFAVNTDGTGFMSLARVPSAGFPSPSGLILSGNTLYGTVPGNGGYPGTVFAVNTDGTGFMNLHNFTSSSGYPYYTNSDGLFPEGSLILSGNTLYGTASEGGSGGSGTVFSLTFTPQLTITPSGTKVILSWPTNFAGFDYTGYRLQSTTSLSLSAVWTTNLPPPVVNNGQNVVTNLITGKQQFYRLSQ